MPTKAPVLPAEILSDDLLIRQPCAGMAEALADYKPRTIPLPRGLKSTDHGPYDLAFVSVQSAQEFIEGYPKRPYHELKTFYYSHRERPSWILGDMTLLYGFKGPISLTWTSAYRAPRHKGYATQAVRALIRTLRQQTDRKIIASIADHNKPSQALAQRLGMIEAQEIKSFITPSHQWELPDNIEM